MIKVKRIMIILLFFLLVLPACMASSNGKQMDNHFMNESLLQAGSSIADSHQQTTDETTNSDIVTSRAYEKHLLNKESPLNDVYFDSSLTNDNGNGSKDNPYKRLTTARIANNNNIHLADGEYKLNAIVNVRNITFIGQSTTNTIIIDGRLKNSNSNLIIYNLTLTNCEINNTGLLSINNVIYNTSKHIKSMKNNTLINNVTFINCSDEIGGAIYANDTTMSINNSRFENCSGIDGASILARNSKLNISNTVFIDNHSNNIGGAIAALTTTTQLSNVTFRNNSAKYYGGCIYSIYGSVIIEDSVFEYNLANDGASLYIDEAKPAKVYENNFTNNNANTSIVYLVSCNLKNNISQDNRFPDIDSLDVCVIDKPNMFIGNGNYSLINYNYTENDTLPDMFDLREYGYVTSVKNQGADGNCWAFASIATLESCLLKASNVSYDFSEENMKNLMAQYSDYGWSFEVNDGGNTRMSLGYLTGWLGPVYENEDTYRTNSLLSPILNSSIHVQDVIILTRKNYTDNVMVKKALMNYGSVGSTLAWDWGCVIDGNYYCNHTATINHAISIVGWDDNYSRYNFKSTPIGDGAWIIKNSWGENSGLDGYYYISYYDMYHALGNDLFTFSFNDESLLEKNYQYDISGITDYFYYPANSVWYKNIYNITSNEYLEAVSTYFNDNTNFTVTINVNRQSKLIQEDIISSGYHTIYLSEKIALHKGDLLEIIFKITTESDVGVPISEIYSLNKMLYDKNISFVSLDGITWNDLYELDGTYPGHTYSSQVASIKAFTQNMKASLKVTADNNNPCEITAKVTDQYENIISDGDVCFMIADEKITVPVNNGIATLKKEFALGLHNITAIYINEGYNLAQDSIHINIASIAKKECNILLSYDVSDKYITLKAKLVDDNSNQINSGKIVFKVNGKSIKDANGKVIYVKVTNNVASVNYMLDDNRLNNLSFTATYSGSTNYHKANNTTIIELSKKVPTIDLTPFSDVRINSSITLLATVTYPDNSNSNGKVVFKINGKTIKDADGKIIYVHVTNNIASINYTIPTNLKVKTYIITAVYISSNYENVETVQTLNVIK